MSAPVERVDILARRVRWLDRYRRLVSLPLALLAWVLISRELSVLFGGEWPSVIAFAVSALFAAAAWWVIEIAFAWMIAMWETEYDRLSRDRGLPRAILRRRRK